MSTGEDEVWLAEVRRRLREDSGFRYSLDEALAVAGLTLTELEPDTPRRIWLLGPGQWLSPRCRTEPLEFLPAPPVFLGGDEFGNRPVCVRLPGGRLLCVNWRVPLRRELYDPDS